MHLDSKIDVRKRLVDYIESRTTDYAASEMPIQSSRYFDPEYLRLEFDRVTSNHPVVVAHTSELASPGSFVTRDAAGIPLVVIRQDDGSVRAFANACRHRGAQVETEPSGRRKMFSCPYHRWCYSRDGSIRSIPYEDGFVGIDRTERGLLQYPTDEYAGLIWVMPRAGHELDMRAVVGTALDRDIAASGLADTKLYRQQTFRLAINWKVVMDGFTDAYHLQFVHPTTVGPFFHTNIYAFDSFGKNSRTVVARRGVEAIPEAQFDYDRFVDFAIPNFTIYPGTVITTEPRHFEAWSIAPDSTNLDHCVVTLRFLVHDSETTEKAQRSLNRNWDLLLETVEDEDWVVVKTISDGLAGSRVPELIYGRNEKATQFFHTQLQHDVFGDGQTNIGPDV